ncbi:hypothetical protein [Pyxidicoccus sp. MSG2]|uniref:hypothetical protein n=1 Tax=Pyxidicoccus sp. MSG2 TaxID=2996790 RepID=UPI00226F54A9|nr:hypothetical protein [Pyxidicoccus sp. MSG2]MCY1014904.1 hypothetical protein [Pyxidicoccus sp. MSG2]
MSLAADVLLRRVLGSVLLLLLAGPARASEPWRVVAHVASAEDEALLERVRGQSSDLPVLLVEDPGPPFEGPSSARWLAAEGRAERHQARVVLWFLRDGADVHVQVAEPSSRHLFVRSARLDGKPGSLEWSAGAEALALAVRSALRAVDMGEPLGEVVEPPAVPPPVPVAPPAPVRTVEAPPPASSPGQWMLSVGAHAALDGYARRGHQGLLLGAGWEGDSLRLGLQFLAGLPARLSDAHTRLTLGQQGAVLWADVPLASTGPLGCAAGLGAGAVVFTRRTEALAPEVDAAPSSAMLALLLGPRLTARWSPATRLALEASLSAELLLGRPSLGYAIEGNIVPRGDGWAVRPRAGLAMVFLP